MRSTSRASAVSWRGKSSPISFTPVSGGFNGVLELGDGITHYRTGYGIGIVDPRVSFREIDNLGNIAGLDAVNSKEKTKSRLEVFLGELSNLTNPRDAEGFGKFLRERREEFVFSAMNKNHRRILFSWMKNFGWRVPALSTSTVDNRVEVRFEDASDVDQRDELIEEESPRFIKFAMTISEKGTKSSIEKVAKGSKMYAHKFSVAHDWNLSGTQWATVEVGSKPGEFPFGEYVRTRHPIEHSDVLKVRYEIQSSNVFQPFLADVDTVSFVNYSSSAQFSRDTELGKNLLKGKFEDFLRVLFAPSPYDSDALAQVKDDLLKGSRKFNRAASMLPSSMIAERSILSGLGDMGEGNLSRAVKRIPRYIRDGYVFAYQSYIWNHVASKRLEMDPTSPIEGDVVLLKTRRSQYVDEFPVCVIGKDDIPRYTIEDVVLPIPGSRSVLPANDSGDFLESMLSKDYLSLEILGKKSQYFGAVGGYRTILATPENFEIDGDTIRATLPVSSDPNMLIRELNFTSQ